MNKFLKGARKYFNGFSVHANDSTIGLFIYFERFVYLLERQSHRERSREIEGDRVVDNVAKEARILHLGLSCGHRTQALGPSSWAFPSMLAGSCTRKDARPTGVT